MDSMNRLPSWAAESFADISKEPKDPEKLLIERTSQRVADAHAEGQTFIYVSLEGTPRAKMEDALKQMPEVKSFDWVEELEMLMVRIKRDEKKRD